jgi:hypothetical protein
VDPNDVRRLGCVSLRVLNPANLPVVSVKRDGGEVAEVVTSMLRPAVLFWRTSPR